MKIKMKKKLRDLTIEEYEEWRATHCFSNFSCAECPFNNVQCGSKSDSWIYNKEFYSDKFLDREIIIEVQTNLTNEEAIILNSIRGYKYIVRNSNKKLFLHTRKPMKADGDWWPIQYGYQIPFPFDDKFNFITVNDTEPYSI